MINRISARAGLTVALAAVVAAVVACAADVPTAGGSGPSPASSSSSGVSGAPGDPGSGNLQSPVGTTESGSGSAPAVDSTTTDSTTADSITAAEGSRTAPPIYQPPPTSASGTDGTSAGGAASPIPAGLDGYRFRADGVTGRTLVSGTALSIGFANGTVSVNAGCNSGRGAPVFAGATFAVREMVTTNMACRENSGGNAIMNQRSWYLDWLTKGVGWKLDGGNLVLTGHGVIVTFARLGPADPLDTGAAASSTAAITAAPTAPGSNPDEPTAATPGTLVRPRPPTSSTTMSPKTQRPGDSIPIEPTS